MVNQFLDVSIVQLAAMATTAGWDRLLQRLLPLGRSIESESQVGFFFKEIHKITLIIVVVLMGGRRIASVGTAIGADVIHLEAGALRGEAIATSKLVIDIE